MSNISQLNIDDLPAPPQGKRGWPWTVSSDVYPRERSNGSNWPLLRIVTPSYQQAEYLEETIRSVLLQRYPRLEYYVIDGGSKDGSIEVIEAYQSWLSGWVSENDHGQVHAIRKGLIGARTDYFTWLNSDDLLQRNALRILDFAEYGRAIAGIVTNFSDNSEVVSAKANQGLDLETFSQRWSPSVFHQPGVFWPCPEKLMYHLDEALHYTFDVKLLIWSMILFGPVNCFQHPVASFRLHEQSKTVSLADKFKPEMVRVFDEFIALRDLDAREEVRSSLRRKRLSVFLLACLEGSWPKPVKSIAEEVLRNPSFLLDREVLGALRKLLL